MQFLLNHLCFKCRIKLCFQTVKLYKSTSTIENGVIVDTLRQLGFTEWEANQIARHKHVQNVEVPKMKRIVERLKKLGFPPEEIVQCPMVLKSSSTSIDHYVKILEESGVSYDNIKLELITRAK
ncbi:uncharacterized protein LOC124373402 [Homalodisca vitripennis]|uniref:uncharacterized protein LOC124373402 n=1 Tax=Homalodisca vitripennis TaxID=197043 RepID=UPI001EEB444F|nr:uncharacterized protein LOC124373402 [Homalodisca vitripennis]XP_046687728.1 uncharacterized protein LOC124373402 [Homalodisca vitripennis]XP_046687729.1 uncharacterized protein LOC124373402 [Homalodisca vitripennis]XP_046687730.1 uncharacterized protein LOC124373402 [Homalodisca vitripennis]XP_046687731.1 uncharacterized protein LOC124373402 [Homalodisca vitripennis]